jgi:hypothetical protein
MIPPRSNRTTSIEFDREAYQRCNLIASYVNRLKTVPPYCRATRKNCQSLRLNAIYCRRKDLDQNRQHGLVLELTSIKRVDLRNFDRGFAAPTAANAVGAVSSGNSLLVNPSREKQQST